MKLFGSSGIRRIADRNLIELALKTGLAVGEIYDDVVVGSDTRTSGDAVKHAFISGLLAGGSRVDDAGIIPTPTLALAARDFNAGAMITASHNPPEYNGIKLINPDGSAFDANQRLQIEDMIANDALKVTSWGNMKSNGVYENAVDNHIQHILTDIPEKTNIKVVLDCGCGAASVITSILLERMGCEVIPMNCTPGGFFPHDIEPVEENLGDLIKATKENGAELGIAHDGDADRMMAVDDKGRFIPGDKLLVLFAQQIGAKHVVTTIDASMVIDEMDFNVTRTRVGDIYVSEELKKGGDFGGEPSGAWIFPKNSLCPDGIYAAARLVVIASRHRLSEMVDRIPQYSLLRGNSPSQNVSKDELGKRLLALKPLSVSTIDGIKLTFDDGWLLIRASGTEPKIRITTEAKSEKRVHELYDDGIGVIKECTRGDKED
jgi:phosphoglucosamine mutase